MAQVVMLTGLAGKDVDIIPGDVCVCSESTAVRFLAVGYAREYDAKADAQRRVKHLPGTEHIEPEPAKGKQDAAKPVQKRKSKGKQDNAQTNQITTE